MRPTALRPLLAIALVFVGFTLAACPDDPTKSNDLSWIGADGGVDQNAQQVKLDATSSDTWTYVSFAKGVVPAPAKPEESLDWDLAFQRYNIKTNGGTSGKGQGAASDLGERDLKTTTRAEVSKWTADAVIEDARTSDKRSMNAVLSGWYAYHFIKHELVSLYHLYAVRAADGRIALFKVHDYYDEAGTSGKYTIIYRFPANAEQTDGGSDADAGSPDGGTAPVLDDVISEADGVVTGETNLDARAGKTYFAFAKKGAVQVDGDQKASSAWDLSFDAWLLQTNSGTSGTALGGAASAGTTDFAQATSAPEAGWDVDDVETIGSEQRQESTNKHLAGWFDYDPTTQKIRSAGDVTWIRTADGKFAKFQIVGYYHPNGEGAFYRLRWAYRADGGRTF